MGGERPPMEAALSDMRGRLPGISRVALAAVALLGIVLLSAIALFGYRLIAASGAFDVSRVEVTGAGMATQAVQRAALDQAGGTSMLNVDPSALAQQLAALPRVQSATVDRAFPHTLAITVVPERPVAIAPTGSGRVVLAASGRVLGEVTQEEIALAVVAGIVQRTRAAQAVGPRTAIDPTSGSEILVDETTPSTEYEGTTYFFSCNGCKGRFLENPAKFVGTVA